MSPVLKSKSRSPSLASILIVAFLTLSFSVLLLSSTLETYFNFRAQQAVITTQQQAIAQEAANTVKSFVQEKSSELEVAARLGGSSQINSEDNQRLVLNKLLGLEPAFRQLTVLNGSKQEVAGASRISRLVSSEFAKKASTDGYAAARQKQSYIGPVYLDETTSEPMVVMAAPITDIWSNFQGALIAEVNLKFMWELVGTIKVGTQGQAYVVNRRGDLIAFHDTSRILKGENLKELEPARDFANNAHKSVSKVSQGINHTSVISSFVPLVSPDWAVVVEMPVAEAYKTVFQGLIRSLLIIMLGALLAVISSIFLSRKIIEPILSLTHAAQEIGRGKLDTRITVKSTSELNALATTFNEMTESLQNSSHKLGEEHARLQASINSLDLGFLMTMKNGDVVSSNPALTKIFGLEATTAHAGSTLSIGLIQKQLSNFDLQGAIKDCLTSGKSFSAGEVNLRSCVLSIIGEPIRLEHNEIIGSVMVVEDITEEIVLGRSKDEFFSIASHELRTPLTAIRGNARMIMDYYTDVMKDKNINSMLSDIHGSSVRLIDIVNDFLDVSRIEQGKVLFKNETFSIQKVIESVVYEMQSVLNEKHLELKSDKISLGSLPPVWADTNRTKQIVYNLVGNAAKFTEKGTITIAASVHQKMMKITVTDTGHGIPLDKQQLLFRKFQQAGSSILTRDASRGTGLGLYISKMLVEHMGGTVNLERSVEGKGTTFSFTLPLASNHQQKAKM